MERKLTAILSADVQGYSRLMGEDEEATISTLTAYRAVMGTMIQQHRGRVVDSPGDNLLAEFASVVDAVQCAVAVQQALQAKNAELPGPRQMQFRIGINVGDVVVEGERLYGDGVNIAARVESLADAGGICIAGTVYDQIETKLALTYDYLGEQAVKNIAKPVRVFRVVMDGTAAASVSKVAGGKRQSRVGVIRHKWIVAGLALIAVTLVTLWSLSSRKLSTQDSALRTEAAPAALPLPDKPSIVVLPFDNMSGDPQQDYFSNGITEVLTSDLSRISSLFVIARNTAFTYKGKAVNVQDMRKELGVRYVLEGSVQKAGEQVRIVAQLIDATTDSHLWSERYDRPLTDIFALQDEIVQKIVTTLKLQLTLEEQGYIARKHTNNLEAYDSLLRGIEYFGRTTKETNAQARRLFEQALALDPQYAEAYARLGWTYMLEWDWHWSTDPQTLERAWALAHQAVALDDSLPGAHSSLSYVYQLKRQYDQAIAEAERAITLDPNAADSYALQAQALNFAGRPEEALRGVEQAMRLNPRYPPWYLFELGWAYELTGRYAEAIATLKEASSRGPNFMGTHMILALSYLSQWLAQQSPVAQTLEPAVAAVQRAIALNDSWHWNHIILGRIYLSQKQYEQALTEIERGVALAPTEAGTYAALAEVLSCVGRMEDALEATAQALRLKPVVADDHLHSVGTAYAVAGHYEEARAPLQRFLSHYPNRLDIHLMLAVVYNELGQATEARAEAAEVLRLNPQFSLETHRQRAPIKDPAVLERHLAALRKAGLK